jgi:hypothetical protein
VSAAQSLKVCENILHVEVVGNGVQKKNHTVALSTMGNRYIMWSLETVGK